MQKEKTSAFKLNTSEEEIIAYIDKDKFDKIITNILSNAFKFTPEGGEIEVSISSSRNKSSKDSHAGPVLMKISIDQESQNLSKPENQLLKRIQIPGSSPG